MALYLARAVNRGLRTPALCDIPFDDLRQHRVPSNAFSALHGDLVKMLPLWHPLNPLKGSGMTWESPHAYYDDRTWMFVERFLEGRKGVLQVHSNLPISALLLAPLMLHDFNVVRVKNATLTRDLRWNPKTVLVMEELGPSHDIIHQVPDGTLLLHR